MILTLLRCRGHVQGWLVGGQHASPGVAEESTPADQRRSLRPRRQGRVTQRQARTIMRNEIVALLAATRSCVLESTCFLRLGGGLFEQK
jgi:hypothetical protein